MRRPLIHLRFLVKICITPLQEESYRRYRRESLERRSPRRSDEESDSYSDARALESAESGEIHHSWTSNSLRWK